MNRERAWDLVCLHTKGDSLRRHMLGVEACLRHYAAKLGEDPDLWGVTGLLHDFDYEAHPEEHPLWGMAELERLGTDPVIVRAIASHYAEKTGVQPESSLERHLVACDELTGFIAAVAYVRPSKSVLDVEVKSVTKKLKEPSFAAPVDRGHIQKATEAIGLTAEEHIGNMLEAMKSQAEKLGLAGTAVQADKV
ncbi:MAG: HDIG domain-containing protein [Fimbriimonadaceae bacterium]|nr:HDIG domain-containing protein [Fimbriimonadaceae bacterium]QYK56199.1 MAG: HDIG domain-containing protein [Fimbriimonadaceae bacterium]